MSRLRLRVSPGAARSAVVGRYGNAWKVRVAAVPEDGKANDAVVELVARSTGVARDRVTLVSGFASRDKIVELDGVDPESLERVLEVAAAKEEG
jgi:hypothetical protein